MSFQLTPDQIVYWQAGAIKLNATIVFTWVVMALLVSAAWLATRNLTPAPTMSPWQSLLETLVLTIRDQIRQVADQDPGPYLPFIGTLFLFISVANFLDFVPGYRAPTSSLSATSALALCTFFAVPWYGIRQNGVRGYLRHYIEPTPIILPFEIIGELSRTLALAVRLFGNIMSGALIVAVLLAIVPLVVPVALQLLNLVIGQIQAYIFAVLSMVFIASVTRAQEERVAEKASPLHDDGGEEDADPARDAREPSPSKESPS